MKKCLSKYDHHGNIKLLIKRFIIIYIFFNTWCDVVRFLLTYVNVNVKIVTLIASSI